MCTHTHIRCTTGGVRVRRGVCAGLWVCGSVGGCACCYVRVARRML